jgi:hypothetical protein
MDTNHLPFPIRRGLANDPLWVNLVTAALLSIAAAISSLGQSTTNEVTGASITDDLKYQDVKDSYVLALRCAVDNTPLYVDDALIAVQLADGHWRLAHVARNPRDKSQFLRHWDLFRVTDRPIVPSRDFPEKPTPLQVAEFIHDSFFQFRPPDRFRLISGEVFYKT